MIALYKHGETHTVDGINCHIGRFNNSELQYRLSEGWVLSPQELEKSKGEKVEVKEIEITENPREIRMAAKKAGIDDWDRARVRTLKDKLADAQG